MNVHFWNSGDSYFVRNSDEFSEMPHTHGMTMGGMQMTQIKATLLTGGNHIVSKVMQDTLCQYDAICNRQMHAP